MPSTLSSMPSMVTITLLLLYHQMGPFVVLSNKDIILPSFSWDPRNECFNSTVNDKGYAQISVDQDSQMYFICPSIAITYDVQTSYTPRKFMFENMYMCTKKEFDDCEITKNDDKTRLVMKCDDPLDTQKLKYKHFSFASTRSSMEDIEFQAGTTYYFIATSDGTQSGLKGQKDGRCKTNNMRLAIHICEHGQNCHRNNRRCNKDGVKSKESSSIQPPKPSAPKPVKIEPTKPPTTIRVVTSVSDPESLRSSNTAGSSAEKNLVLYIVLAGIGGLLIGIILAAVIWTVRRTRSARRRNPNRDSGAPSTITEHLPVDDADEQKEDLDTFGNSVNKIETVNQKYFTSIDYRNSNEFRRLISTASTCSSNRYSDGERHCVTPVGGYK